MSFSITVSKPVDLVDSTGKIVGTSSVDVALTLKVKTVMVSDDSATAHVYSTSSVVQEGDLEGCAIWEFYGYYEVTIDPSSTDSVITQAESQVKTQLIP